MPPRSVKHGLGRAGRGWTRSPGPAGLPLHRQGSAPGKSAELRGNPGPEPGDRTEGHAPRGKEGKVQPHSAGMGTAHTPPALSGGIAEPSSTRASTSLWVCYSSLKCRGSWRDWLSVYKCRWGEGSRFLSPCGFPTLKAARAIRGGRKGKEKRISQFQHSSDLPCHCTTRCSVC